MKKIYSQWKRPVVFYSVRRNTVWPSERPLRGEAQCVERVLLTIGDIPDSVVTLQLLTSISEWLKQCVILFSDWPIQWLCVVIGNISDEIILLTLLCGQWKWWFYSAWSDYSVERAGRAERPVCYCVESILCQCQYYLLDTRRGRQWVIFPCWEYSVMLAGDVPADQWEAEIVTPEYRLRPQWAVRLTRGPIVVRRDPLFSQWPQWQRRRRLTCWWWARGGSIPSEVTSGCLMCLANLMCVVWLSDVLIANENNVVYLFYYCWGGYSVVMWYSGNSVIIAEVFIIWYCYYWRYYYCYWHSDCYCWYCCVIDCWPWWLCILFWLLCSILIVVHTFTDVY